MAEEWGGGHLKRGRPRTARAWSPCLARRVCWPCTGPQAVVAPYPALRDFHWANWVAVAVLYPRPVCTTAMSGSTNRLAAGLSAQPTRVQGAVACQSQLRRPKKNTRCSAHPPLSSPED